MVIFNSYVKLPEGNAKKKSRFSGSIDTSNSVRAARPLAPRPKQKQPTFRSTATAHRGAEQR